MFSWPLKAMAKNETVFALLDELHQIHGLRNDDFIKYRRYCSRKLERLRSKFNLKNDSKGKPSSIPVELCQKDIELLHLTLFKCEWYWSQINQLRNELSVNSRKKHHLKSICLSALRSIESLKKQTSSSLKNKSFLNLEYCAYLNFFEGVVRNELKEYSSALFTFQKAKVVLELLVEENYHVPLLESKISEIETFIRVCQYSADMYDSIIECKDSDLAAFKNQLVVEKLAEELSDVKVKASQPESLKLGELSFNPSAQIKILDSSSKSYKVAKSVLKSIGSRSPDYENAKIQLAYFELRHFGKTIDSLFENFAKKPNVEDCLAVLMTKYRESKKICKAFQCFARSKFVSLSEGEMKEFCDLTIKIGFCLMKVDNVFGKDELEVSKFSSELVKHFELISGKHAEIKNLRFVPLYHLSKFGHRAIDNISRKHVIKNAVYAVRPAAPVLPKPVFYDMAFDMITCDPKSLNSHATKAQSSGFSNLLSGLLGRK